MRELPQQMNDILPYPRQRIANFRDYISRRYEQPYLRSSDRDAFLASMKESVLNFLLPVVHNPCLIELIQIWKHAFHIGEPYERTLTQLVKCRHEYIQQQYVGQEYNQPYIPVGDLRDTDKPNKITNFIIRCEVYDYFLTVIVALEKARKRGGLHEREEISILKKTKTGEKMKPVRSVSEVGFQWNNDHESIQVKALYNKLRTRGYIDKQTSLEQFTVLFSGEAVEYAVVWLKPASQLLFFIEQLLDHELLDMPELLAYQREKRKELLVKSRRGTISEKQKKENAGLLHGISQWQYERMSACFINSVNGKPYSSKSLKHTRNQLDNRSPIPRNGSEIEQIVKDVAKLKSE